MMDKKLQHIEDYLAGKLEKKEQEEFELDMQNDDELAAEVQLFQDIMGGVRLKGNKGLKSRLNEIHEQVVNKPNKRVAMSARRKYGLAIAAAILVLLAVTFLLPKQKTSSENLYANHFTPYEATWNTRNAQTNIELTEIKQLYESQQYESLISRLEKDSLLNTVESLMIKGIAHLETGHFEQAQQYFKEASENPLLNAQARWYLALTYLKSNDIENCKLILKKFAQNQSSDYYKEAISVLENL